LIRGGQNKPIPELFHLDAPVDIVYTWVDGTDPSWLARKAQFNNSPASPDATSALRFSDRGELKHSLRSIEMFAPWVNHIWLVTDNQRPSWLVEDDKLTVVDHREIFTDPSVLPVFNSHAIETQIHHIPDLAEHFVYFNDDLFLARPVTPELFFAGNGMSLFALSPTEVLPGPVAETDMAVESAAKNTRDFLIDVFGRTPAHKIRHIPHAHLRSNLYEIEETHPEVIAASLTRFREPGNFPMLSMLGQYYAYAKGRAALGEIHQDYTEPTRDTFEYALARWPLRRDLDVVCVNNLEALSRAKNAAVERFYASMFPSPSRWER
jgi:hypothetical protein